MISDFPSSGHRVQLSPFLPLSPSTPPLPIPSPPGFDPRGSLGLRFPVLILSETQLEQRGLQPLHVGPRGAGDNLAGAFPAPGPPLEQDQQSVQVTARSQVTWAWALGMQRGKVLEDHDLSTPLPL